MEFINFDEILLHIRSKIPYYIWVYEDGRDKCYKIVDINNLIITLESGLWLAPIPIEFRKNNAFDLRKKYSNYVDIKDNDGTCFLKSIKLRKDSSEIVAWKPNKEIKTITFDKLKKQNYDFIIKQKWRCRYCNKINNGGLTCNGISKGNMPIGGPEKVKNHVLSEYIYFVSKTYSCPPNFYPFDYDKQIGWYNNNAMQKYKKISFGQKCNARRCIHYSHINQSDQIL